MKRSTDHSNASENDHPRALPPRVDPFALLQKGEPDRVYAGLRAAGPLLRGGPGMWVVPRYREVASLLRNPALASFQFMGAASGLSEAPAEGVLGDGAASSFLRRVVVASDGAEHARVRKVLARVVGTFGAQVREHVPLIIDGLLSDCAERGTIDAVSDLAYPLPLRVLGRLFGLPHDTMDTVGRCVLKLSNVFAPVIDSEHRSDADAAVTWLRAYLGTFLSRPGNAEGGNLTTKLWAAHQAGELSWEECVDNTIFLLFAGLETSMNLIAAGAAALARFPAQMLRLRQDPTLAPSAVEEFLRYEAPTQITARVARAPVQVAGRDIQAGRIMLLLLASANRDADQFHEPDELDIGRHPNPHLSFGAGAHYCLGAGLARLEGEMLFARLAQRFSAFDLAGPPVRKPHATPRVYTTVPVVVQGG